jgi:YHS domain-containing protein
MAVEVSMKRIMMAVLFVVLVILSGCGSGDGTTTPAAQPGGEDARAPPGAPAGALPAGANQVCPVMGGTVDPRLWFSHGGRKVYFCCAECIPEFRKDPETYFAKAYPDAE